jgi:hypothetical protein
MPFVTYTATESIAPGHVANVLYTLTFAMQRADLQPEILKSEQRSMSGVKETLHFGSVRRWSIMVEPIPAELLPYFDEFLDSTADGQTFILDPYGDELAPLQPASVERDDKGHTISRMIVTDDPMHSDMFEISFDVSEVV